MSKIEDLKVELFNLIRAQDLLRLRFNEIEKQKQAKGAELTKAEQENAKLESGKSSQAK